MKRLLVFLASWAVLLTARGYVVRTDDSGVYVIKWQSSPVTFQVKLSDTANLIDGTSLSSSFGAAVQAWNAQLGAVQMASQASSVSAYATGNGTNEVAMDSTVGGDAFGSGVLAVTLSYWKGNSTTETDIVFNTAYTWNSYRGNLRSGVEDFRRVAIHELGHVLGLKHPDENGQSVTALMNSRESNLDALAEDDIAGGQKLYAGPGYVPANDDFANAAALTLSNGSAQGTGANMAGTRQTGEPNHVSSNGTHSVWWKWTAAANDSVTVDTLGSNFDTALAVYTGSSVGALTLVASNDDAEPLTDNSTPQRKRTSLVNFEAVNGTNYYFAVDGWNSAPGNLGGYTGSIVVNLRLVTPVAPAFTSQPSGKTVEAGQTAQFSASASGVPAPGYRWQRLPSGGSWTDLSDGGGYSGTGTGTLSVVTALAMDGDQYRCVATNTKGSAVSGAAVLTVSAPVTPPTISAPMLDQTAMAGGAVTFSVKATGTGPLSYQWEKDGATLFDGGRFSGVKSATLAIVNLVPEDAGFYSVFVSNSIGKVSERARLYIELPPPVILRQSRSQAVYQGETATFSVSVSGYGFMDYEWRKDGALLFSSNGISGVTTPTLTISNVQGSNEGAYTVTIRNNFSAGAVGVTSMPARLIVNQPPGVIAIAAGRDHSLFLRYGGSLWAMGRNSSGQLGDGTTTDRKTPVLVAEGVSSVAAGYDHSLFIKSDGSLWTMGSNVDGKLGDGSEVNRSTPVKVATNVAAAFGGEYHSLFIKTDHTLWGIGGNYGGQFGDGTKTNHSTPVQIAADVIAAAAGGEHTLYVKSDGTLWTTGQGWAGQLGDGGSSTRLVPIQVATSVKAVAAGAAHSVFLKTDGTLWGMGHASLGELGGVSSDLVLSPVQISSSATSVSAIGGRTLFVLPDKKVGAFGWSGPVAPVYPGFTVAAVAAGGNHGLYLGEDGTLYVFGGNSYGQLGDGTTADRLGLVLTGGALSTKKPRIVVVAEDKARAAGAANPALTAIYSGFVDGDTVDVLDVLPTLSTSATGSSLPGAYTITLSGGSDNKYDLVLDDGTLTVTANASAPIITSGSAASFGVGVAGNFTVTATGSPTPNFSATGLPSWASLNAVTGVLSGTPPNASGSPFTITITASNGTPPNASQTFTLTVRQSTSGPSFNAHPANQSVTAGGSAAFSASAGGTPAPSYQWQLSTNGGGSWTNLAEGSPYSGTSSTTLNLASTTPAMTGYQYRCVATNGSGSANSNAAVLTVSGVNVVGTYFGTLPNGHGRWAMRVNADNTAVFLAHLAQRGTAVVAHLTVAADGSFATSGTETVPAASRGGTWSASDEAQARGIDSLVAANFSLTGKIGSGSVNGQIGGLNETLSGSLDAGAGAAASGFYQASALNAAAGSAYAVVAASGQTLVVTVATAGVDSGTGSLGGDGQLSATTAGGGSLVFGVGSSGQTASVALTPAGATTPVNFAGLADGVVATTHLANIATRAYCSVDNQVTIGGFVVAGSGSKRVLIRAVGPSLTAQGIGAAEALADPTIEVHDAIHGNTTIATNDNWGDNADAATITSTAATVGAAALLGSDTKSSALLLTLSPGVYSFVVKGKNAASGIVLLEVYDADAGPAGVNFSNIATRAQATTGNGVTIGGFVITGNAPKRVLLRAVGPTLTAQGLGVAEVLADPTIELHDASHGNVTIATNDNWSDNANAAEITTTGARIGATPFAGADAKSAALLVNLQPGVYSFIASGKSAAPSGIVLVEVYDAD